MGETREKFLSRIKWLNDSGAPWHELGEALRGRPEGGDASAWKPLLADAAQITEIAPIVLARYVGLLDKLHAIAASPEEFESLLPPRFSSGEIAARLYDRNPERGLRAFKDLRARKTTLEKLREELAGEPVPRNKARGRSLRDRAKIVKATGKALSAHAARLFGAGSAVASRPPLRHLMREGYDILTPTGVRRDGVDLYLPEPPAGGRDALEPLARSMLLSFYFERFYLLFAPGFAPSDVDRAIRLLATFEAASESVGILFMPDEHTVDFAYTPRTPREGSNRLFGYERLVRDLRPARG